MPNSVKMTFEGDSTGLDKSFDDVGSSAKKLGDDAAGATKGLDEHASGLSRVGESADKSEQNIIGVHDVIDGTATIMQGPGKQGIVSYLQGWADLAGGLAPLLLNLADMKVATLAQAAAQKVAAAGAKIWTGAQWLMNTALLASPITWIVVGIVALIAVIVLIATKTDWFQKAWSKSWGWIKSAAKNTWDFIKQIPGWISTAFSKVASFILSPYKAAFNGIANAWNNTVGQLSWTVPSWIPFIGGNSLSVPHLPTFHTGGTVPGQVGDDVLAVLQAGEKVSSIASSSGGGDGGGLVLGSDGSNLGDVLVGLIGMTVRRKYSGDPAALGIKVA
jgi:phage-related protein